jgi:hypothetical protein
VREKLALATPIGDELLQLIATAKGLGLAALAGYAEKPLRALYADVVCGQGVVSAPGAAAAELHVPLARQSAFAGVLLAAAYVLDVAGIKRDNSQLVRFDVMRSAAGEVPTLYAKDDRGVCLCSDALALAVYREKYAIGPGLVGRT